ncbi:MAG: hypothetical protein J6L84_03300 [Clostridiales bacterium]|nr:hypothetical protein [Clostridiales bacterium]
MSVPKGKRRQSRFEAQHHYYRLRDEVTRLMLQDFGFSPEKYQQTIDYYRRCNESAENVDEVVARYEKKAESFNKWFIDKECDAVLQMLRDIETEFTQGNSIYPSDTSAKLIEFITRRYHINNAIAGCFALKQELNYIIRTLPVDLNKFERFGDAIDKQIALYKGVRQADNRFLRERKKGNNTLARETSSILDAISALIHKIGSMEIKE